MIQLESKEMDALDAIKLLRNLPKIISIKGPNYSFNGCINNGELSKSYLKLNDKDYTNSEALGKLLTLSGSVKVTIYEVPINEILKTI